MIILSNTYRRISLKPDELEFFKKIIPLSQKIQEWSCIKARFKRLYTPRGVLASVVAADIIIQSYLGKHPISLPDYQKRYSNNLSLLEAGPYYKGKSQEFGGKTYRAYKDWHSFSIDLSDHYAFSGDYEAVLACETLTQQVFQFCLNKPEGYSKIMMSTISSLGLGEFDL